jgi:hypothetical protein
MQYDFLAPLTFGPERGLGPSYSEEKMAEREYLGGTPQPTAEEREWARARGTRESADKSRGLFRVRADRAKFGEICATAGSARAEFAGPDRPSWTS